MFYFAKMNRVYNKVIVWGYPLDSHTHSYVHFCWVKTFKALGYETHWFEDNNYPALDTFNYTNTIFITEGHCDRNIPLDASNMYFVHACVNPLKYKKSGGRLVDIRYHVAYLHDSVYDYNLNTKINNFSVTNLPDSMTYYESSACVDDLNKQFRNDNKDAGFYEAIYMFWATDLLPHEICYDDRFIKPSFPHEMIFVGSIGSGNDREVRKFFDGCQNNNIICRHVNPWHRPVSFEEGKRMVQQSVIAPDIRGASNPKSNHKEIGYIACRLFKNISYGKLGVTNSPRVKELFGENVLLETQEDQIASLCLQNIGDSDYILKQMKWVAENHTYINRVKDLLSVVEKNNEYLMNLS